MWAFFVSFIMVYNIVINCRFTSFEKVNKEIYVIVGAVNRQVVIHKYLLYYRSVIWGNIMAVIQGLEWTFNTVAEKYEKIASRICTRVI